MTHWPLLLQIGFGLVALSAVFLVYVFHRAWRDDGLKHDRRYRLACGALSVGNVGVFLWSLNPLSHASLGYGLPRPMLILASVLILASSVTLIGSTRLGGDHVTLKIFLILSGLWIAICLIHWLAR